MLVFGGETRSVLFCDCDLAVSEPRRNATCSCDSFESWRNTFFDGLSKRRAYGTSTEVCLLIANILTTNNFTILQFYTTLVYSPICGVRITLIAPLERVWRAYALARLAPTNVRYFNGIAYLQLPAHFLATQFRFLKAAITQLHAWPIMFAFAVEIIAVMQRDRMQTVGRRMEHQLTLM